MMHGRTIFVRSLIWIPIVFAGLTFQAMAQPKTWDDLLIDVPAGWSTSSKKGSTEYSNYNQKQEEPFSITLFDNEEYDGGLDTLFAHAWHTYVQENRSVPPPRWRRFYTNDGLLVQQGFLETGTPGNTVYHQLNVFVLEGAYQACLLKTTSTKYYRTVQYDWQERLLAAKAVPQKKVRRGN